MERYGEVWGGTGRYGEVWGDLLWREETEPPRAQGGCLQLRVLLRLTPALEPGPLVPISWDGGRGVVGVRFPPLSALQLDGAEPSSGPTPPLS